MSDYALTLDSDGVIDIQFSGGDVLREDGLETAVLVSLFADARATEDQIPAIDRDGDLRGFWGDVEPAVPGDSTGSLLWTIRRAKQTSRTLADVQAYARESLQWLIDDKVASEVVVSAAYRAPPIRGWMDLTVLIYRPMSANPVSFRYSYEWSSQILKVA